MNNKRLPCFDILARLAAHEPDALEALRREAIEDCIAEAPFETRARLRGLQWQIDIKRKRASNPLDACVSLSSLMYDSLSQLRDALEGKLDRTPTSAGVVSLAAARRPERRKRR